MPITKYFQGHGEDVMASMRKAHPEYSEARVKSEFYATVNAKKRKARGMVGGTKRGR